MTIFATQIMDQASATAEALGSSINEELNNLAPSLIAAHCGDGRITVCDPEGLLGDDLRKEIKAECAANGGVVRFE